MHWLWPQAMEQGHWEIVASTFLQEETFPWQTRWTKMSHTARQLMSDVHLQVWLLQTCKNVNQFCKQLIWTKTTLCIRFVTVCFQDNCKAELNELCSFEQKWFSQAMRTNFQMFLFDLCAHWIFVTRLVVGHPKNVVNTKEVAKQRIGTLISVGALLNHLQCFAASFAPFHEKKIYFWTTEEHWSRRTDWRSMHECTPKSCSASALQCDSPPVWCCLHDPFTQTQSKKWHWIGKDLIICPNMWDASNCTHVSVTVVQTFSASGKGQEGLIAIHMTPKGCCWHWKTATEGGKIKWLDHNEISFAHMSTVAHSS